MTAFTTFKSEIAALALSARANAEPEIAEFLDALRDALAWECFDADRVREAANIIHEVGGSLGRRFETAADYLDEGN